MLKLLGADNDDSLYETMHVLLDDSDNYDDEERRENTTPSTKLPIGLQLTRPANCFIQSTGIFVHPSANKSASRP